MARKRDGFASDFPGFDPTTRIKPFSTPVPVRASAPVDPEDYSPRKFHQFYYEIVDTHDITPECRIQRARVKKKRFVITCREHLVQWEPIICNVVSDRGGRCTREALRDSRACAFHNHPRVVCEDCGHNIHTKDEDDRTRVLHHEDHRFAPATTDGRFCAYCSLPGHMLNDGRIVHRWDHRPKPIDLPWETVDDEPPTPDPSA